ncbi:PIN domain-containing protein [Sphingomonas sp. UYEF23]|uniref:type II toxin-antitoxin system VapC family toxin n=1 Tax=Sphingomonas sp. UYEF23 TaxID=1756408 RepID=UPI003393291D
MSKPVIYLDTCPIIDLVKVKRGIEVEAGRGNEAWFTERLIATARAGHIRLVSSAIILIEGTHVSEGMPTPDETKDLFNDFLWSGVIEMVAVDPFVCERARDFRWRDGVVLGNADAIHVATALMENAVEFLTTDGKLERKLKHLDVVTRSAGLVMTDPSKTAHLPEEFRSADFFG